MATLGRQGADLMASARSEADFEAFYSASSRRLLGHVYAMVGDLAEAEDALQGLTVRRQELTAIRYATVRTHASGSS
jgi:DNA-directed RNA polymerase specialized sigma24 family protein